jgi:MFS family permease
VTRVAAATRRVRSVDRSADERTTFRLDLLRNAAGGYIDACERTFFLLVAIYLNAGSLAKSLIAGSVGVGFLFSPLVVQRVRRSGRPVNLPAAEFFALAAVASLSAGLFANRFLFLVGAVVGLAMQACTVPLQTALYNRNYPPGRRGRYVSLGIFVRVLMSTVLAVAVGEVLERRLDDSGSVWRVVPLLAACSFGLQSVAMRRVPASPLTLRPDEPENEREAWNVRLRLIRSDALLRNVLTAWMFMGFANLMMLPLRVEYVQNPIYGVDFGPREVTLVTTVVPSLMRLLVTVPFGWAFDRLSFFATRIMVNVAFAISIVSFFLGTSITGLLFGAATLGLAAAGGDVLWNLWTTKFAPPGRVADYMALHTFTTGLRGVVAPFVGFFLIERTSVVGMGVVCAVLIGISSLILVPQYRVERAQRSGATASVG